MGDTPFNTDSNADWGSNPSTPPTQASAATVPSRWISPDTSTVYDWVVLAIETLNEYGVTADEDNIYEWLKVNEFAPDMSKPQIHKAVIKYRDSRQQSLGF